MLWSEGSILGAVRLGALRDERVGDAGPLSRLAGLCGPLKRRQRRQTSWQRRGAARGGRRLSRGRGGGVSGSPLLSALSARWRRRFDGRRARARRGTWPLSGARRVICAARARVRLCCVRVLLVAATCLRPSLTQFPCCFRPPQAYPDATGAGEGGCFRLPRKRPPLRHADDPEYEQSQATSQSEDSRSDVMVSHRMLSSILL